MPPCLATGAAALATGILASLSMVPTVAQPLMWPVEPRTPHIERVGEPSRWVTDIAVDDDAVWVATRGGGIVRIGRDGSRARLDAAHALPSATVWQVQPWGGRLLLAATARGLAVIDLSARSTLRVQTAPPAAHDASGLPADIVRVSPRDGSVFVQLDVPSATDAARAASSLWRWPHEKSDLIPEASPQGAATAARLDEPMKCLDVAGVGPDKDGPLVWLKSECRDPARSLSSVFRASALRDVIGVAAVARNPASGEPVLAVVRQRGRNPAMRTYELLERTPNGTLAPHCSEARYKEELTGLVPDPLQRGLVVALYGAGVFDVACGTPKGRRYGSDPRLRFPTALEPDWKAGRLLVGTHVGLFAMQPFPVPAQTTAVTEPLLEAGNNTPFVHGALSDVCDDERSALVSSPRHGVIRLERISEQWQETGRWAPGSELTLGEDGDAAKSLPPGVYGPAVCAPGGDIHVVLRSQGIVTIGSAGRRWIDPTAARSRPHILGVTRDDDGSMWVATGSTPATPGSGGVRRYGGPRKQESFPLPDLQAEPTGSMLRGPTGAWWVATRAGIVETQPKAPRMRLVSAQRVQTLFVNKARPGAVAVVGVTVERWTGKRFEPVLFGIPTPEKGPPPVLGHPIDVVIDNRGAWVILYSSGRIVLLDERGGSPRILDDLHAPAARKLIHLSKTDEILLGTGAEGVFLFKR